MPRPNLRGLETEDWDERVADLQFRDAHEHAVGHGVAVEAFHDPDGACRRITTRWIPSAEVERVAPAQLEGVELEMESLAALADGKAARAALSGLVEQYRAWIETQRGEIPGAPPRRAETGLELLERARAVADRIAAGIACLDDPQVLQAFRVANRGDGDSGAPPFRGVRGRRTPRPSTRRAGGRSSSRSS